MRRVDTDSIPLARSTVTSLFERNGSRPLVSMLACGVLLAAAGGARDVSANEAAAGASQVAPLAERLIQKREGTYNYRLTLKPGDPKVGRVVEASLEISRVLDIPDPITGRNRPLRDLEPVAEVTPDASLRRNNSRVRTVTARMWPMADPGTYAFHFTPAADGVYTLKVSAAEPLDDGRSRPFDVSFRIGVGSAAAETEQGTGSAVSRRGGRRPVGPSVRGRSAQEQLQRLMEEVGLTWLDLESRVNALPARGTGTKAARDAIAGEARSLATLLGRAAGTAPGRHSGSAAEYDALVKEAVASFEKLAAAAEGKQGAPSPRVAFETAQQVGCLKCHAKFRWDVTSDLSGEGWPWPATTAEAR